MSYDRPHLPPRLLLLARLWRRPSRERVRGGAVVAQVRRGNKFGAVPVVIDGIRFDSTAEGNRWRSLRLLERAGAIFDLRRQVRYPLQVNSTTIGHYVADFVYTHRVNDMEPPDGIRVIEDVKGHQTELFKRSAKHMAAQGNPITIWPPVPVKTRKRRIKA